MGGTAVTADLRSGVDLTTLATAAYAEVAEGDRGPELFLRASVTAIDGSDAVRGSVTGPLPDAVALGRALATELLDRGAAELMAVGS
jgi:hydroxymethylbilane synthase